jgi:hypothetical protein
MCLYNRDTHTHTHTHSTHRESLILGRQCMRTDHEINDERFICLHTRFVFNHLSLTEIKEKILNYFNLFDLRSSYERWRIPSSGAIKFRICSFFFNLASTSEVLRRTSKCCFIWLGTLRNCTDRLSNLLNPESPPLNKEEGNNPFIPHRIHTYYLFYFCTFGLLQYGVPVVLRKPDTSPSVVGESAWISITILDDRRGGGGGGERRVSRRSIVMRALRRITLDPVVGFLWLSYLNDVAHTSVNRTTVVRRCGSVRRSREDRNCYALPCYASAVNAVAFLAFCKTRTERNRRAAIRVSRRGCTF